MGTSDTSTQASTTPPETVDSGRADEQEVSLLDLLLVVARHRSVIVRCVLVTTLLFTAYAVVASSEFTALSTVVRESQEDLPSLGGGLAALQGLGLNFGSLGGGLSPDSYPEILHSREVRLRVARDTFYFPDLERRATYVEYVNQSPGLVGTVLNYTLRLPRTIKRLTRDAPEPDPTSPYPTVEEERALRHLDDLVSHSISDETGLFYISTTTHDSELSAALNDRFLKHLTERIRTLRTEKVSRNLDFVQQRFAEVGEELEAAEDRLATFLARNQQTNTPRLRFEEERLQRQVRFKENLYSELQKQVTQTRLEVQRNQPVVTVLEEPAPPMEPSGPPRALIVVLGVFVGGAVGLGVAFGRTVLSADTHASERDRIEELQATLLSWEAWRAVLREQIDSLNVWSSRRSNRPADHNPAEDSGARGDVRAGDGASGDGSSGDGSSGDGADSGRDANGRTP